jgi:thymidylate synthase (FAD)
MNLSLNYYTQWYWKIDLHNLMHFLSLRMDSHAQYEIRVYANAIAEIVKAWCPLAYEAFEDYKLHAVRFSKQERLVLRDLLLQDFAKINPSALMEHHKLSKREQEEFMKKLTAEI